MLKVLTPDEVSEIAGVSTATLERYRNSGDGPNFLRIGPGGLIKYLESDVEEWLKSCRQLPTAAERMQAAVQTGSAERKAALIARRKELQDLDRESSGVEGVTPLTVGNVGATPGEQIQRFFNVPAQTFEAPAAPHIIQGR